MNSCRQYGALLLFDAGSVHLATICLPGSFLRVSESGQCSFSSILCTLGFSPMLRYGALGRRPVSVEQFVFTRREVLDF